VIKLFWWRLEGSDHGNFGDEITRLLIKKLFHQDSVWSSPAECELIGAGSILQEAYELKGGNRPFVWSSGLISDNGLRIPADAFQFCSVRGNLTLGRIDGVDKSSVTLGDAGLLASYLLPPGSKVIKRKKHRIGILPHYSDVSGEFMRVMRHRGKDIFIIDATWPCERVIESIAQCEVVLSSSLHGLIVADSVGTPNVHVPMSNLLKGGQYKFKDYYSVFSNSDRYKPLTPEEVYSLSNNELYERVSAGYTAPEDLQTIKDTIIAAFPLNG
jgi:pyruvyltransferase